MNVPCELEKIVYDAITGRNILKCHIIKLIESAIQVNYIITDFLPKYTNYLKGC